MQSWEAATLVFFVYVAAVGAALPRLASRQRVQVLAGAALGITLLFVEAQMAPSDPLREWIAPPALLLVGYWTSGMLFVAPMPKAEALLKVVDDRLRITQIARAVPRPLAEFLELAYLGVYPLIPIALVLHVIFADRPDPARFWNVVLTTDYICFGMLPWIQTRTPRALEPGDPWHASVRAFNLRLLRRASIRVNTVPSGHAAEAVVAALLVSSAPWPIVIWMVFNAAAISAGAVFGRYHYAADAITGVAVAVAVWWMT